MTADEFTRFLEALTNRWPNPPLTDGQVVAMAEDLSRHDFDSLMVGVRVLVQQGARWRPVSGEIISASGLATPSASELIEDVPVMILDVVRRFGRSHGQEAVDSLPAVAVDVIRLMGGYQAICSMSVEQVERLARRCAPSCVRAAVLEDAVALASPEPIKRIESGEL